MKREDIVDLLDMVKRAARETARSLTDGSDGFEAMNTFMAKLEAEIQYQENK